MHLYWKIWQNYCNWLKWMLLVPKVPVFPSLNITSRYRNSETEMEDVVLPGNCISQEAPERHSPGELLFPGVRTPSIQRKGPCMQVVQNVAFDTRVCGSPLRAEILFISTLSPSLPSLLSMLHPPCNKPHHMGFVVSHVFLSSLQKRRTLGEKKKIWCCETREICSPRISTWGWSLGFRHLPGHDQDQGPAPQADPRVPSARTLLREQHWLLIVSFSLPASLIALLNPRIDHWTPGNLRCSLGLWETSLIVPFTSILSGLTSLAKSMSGMARP